MANEYDMARKKLGYGGGKLTIGQWADVWVVRSAMLKGASFDSERLARMYADRVKLETLLLLDLAGLSLVILLIKMGMV